MDFERSLAWAWLNMPLTQTACERLPDLNGVRLACSVHLDLKMIPAFETCLERGADLFLTTCKGMMVRTSLGLSPTEDKGTVESGVDNATKKS